MCKFSFNFKMSLKSFAILGLFFVIAVQADYKHELTQTAKDCLTEMKTDEGTVRPLISEIGTTPEDNEVMQNFFGCCLRTHITDTNEVVVDGKLTTYVTELLTKRLDGRRKLAKLLAKECIEECKGVKEDTKGKTAVKTFNCIMTTLQEIVKKDTE